MKWQNGKTVKRQTVKHETVKTDTATILSVRRQHDDPADRQGHVGHGHHHVEHQGERGFGEQHAVIAGPAVGLDAWRVVKTRWRAGLVQLALKPSNALEDAVVPLHGGISKDAADLHDH